MSRRAIMQMCFTHIKGLTSAVQCPDHVAGADRFAVTHLHHGADVLSEEEGPELARRKTKNFIWGVGICSTYKHHLLEKALDLEACLSIDAARDALHATAAREAADVGLGDALNIVAQDLPVTGG